MNIETLKELTMAFHRMTLAYRNPPWFASEGDALAFVEPLLSLCSVPAVLYAFKNAPIAFKAQPGVPQLLELAKKRDKEIASRLRDAEGAARKALPLDEGAMRLRDYERRTAEQLDPDRKLELYERQRLEAQRKGISGAQWCGRAIEACSAVMEERAGAMAGIRRQRRAR